MRRILAEERHGSHVASLGDGYVAVLVARDGGADVAVGDFLDFLNFLRSELLEVGEVESENLG